jgi:hypothetical protein
MYLKLNLYLAVYCSNCELLKTGRITMKQNVLR